MEYISMEKLVFTQDPIFNQKMVDFRFVEQRQEYESVCLDTGENATSPNNCAVFDTRKLTPEKWIIYYEVGDKKKLMVFLKHTICFLDI